MRQSKLFTKTLKEVSSSETSRNAQFLTRGAFVHKNSAGVYSYLPLGFRVIEKISNIIREEINKIEGVELLMPALVDKKYLEATDRFKLDVGFDVKGKNDKEASFSLGWTHEEVIAAISSKYVSSYKDLPFYAYQIQTKFRNEARAKSGLLRGREFLMKDLYSFHTSEKDLFDYYARVKESYFNIFKRCGVETYYTFAAGGDFTLSNTHEFQALSEVGEDTIIHCTKCSYAENTEVSKLKEGNNCPECKGKMDRGSAIEVGNIFPLGTKYSEALNLEFKDEKGKTHPVVMGSYGIGISRLMGTIVEIHHDDAGIVWPSSVAPFAIHIIALGDLAEVTSASEKLYQDLLDVDVEVLYDDRSGLQAGEKFADADLIGSPLRVTVSERSLEGGGIELKHRDEDKSTIVNVEKFLSQHREK